jgi:hypothetical protein
VNERSTNANEHVCQIAGRHIAIPLFELCAVWTAFVERHIEMADLRVWIATREMNERRRCLSDERKPRYNLSELHRLVGGVGGTALRGSLRRLERLGLVRIRRGEIRFLGSVEDLCGVDRTAVARMLGEMPKRKTIPLPRRLGRLLASGVKRSVASTIFGELIRCAYFHSKTGWSSEGNAKAVWVANTFSVSERSVLRARAELEASGLIQRVRTRAWHTKRFGARYRVDLSWSPAKSTVSAGEVSGYPESRHRPAPAAGGLSPDPASSACRLAGLESEPTPLRGSIKNHKPAPSAEPRVVSSKKHRAGKPNFLRVHPGDLEDTGQLLGLLEHARSLGIVGRSEMDELCFVAAAELAKGQSTRDPCALFVWCVRRRFPGLTCRHEDLARARLRSHREPSRSDQVLYEVPQPLRNRLSGDALFVRAVLGAVRARGCTADPFPVVRRERPDWTRERWNHALSELDSGKGARWAA